MKVKGWCRGKSERVAPLIFHRLQVQSYNTKREARDLVRLSEILRVCLRNALIHSGIEQANML